MQRLHFKKATESLAYNFTVRVDLEGIVAYWCNSLTLKPEQSGGVGPIPSRTLPLHYHDKRSQTREG